MSDGEGRAARRRERRERLIAEGRCVQCGAPSLIATRCEACREYQARHAREAKARRAKKAAQPDPTEAARSRLAADLRLRPLTLLVDAANEVERAHGLDATRRLVDQLAAMLERREAMS